MKKENFIQFDRVFSAISFIYIFIFPFIFPERNRTIFLCFSLIFFIEKVISFIAFKDNLSKNKKLIYLLITVIFAVMIILALAELFGIISFV